MIDIKVEVTGMGAFIPYVGGVRVAEEKLFLSYEEAIKGALFATGANLTFVDREGKQFTWDGGYFVAAHKNGEE